MPSDPIACATCALPHFYHHHLRSTTQPPHLSRLCREVVPDYVVLKQLALTPLIQHVLPHTGAPQAEQRTRLQLVQDAHPGRCVWCGGVGRGWLCFERVVGLLCGLQDKCNDTGSRRPDGCSSSQDGQILADQRGTHPHTNISSRLKARIESPCAGCYTATLPAYQHHTHTHTCLLAALLRWPCISGRMR